MGLQSLLRALYHLGYSLLRSCQISDAERLAGGNLIVISDLGDLILEVGQPPTEELSPPLDVYPPEEAIDDPFHLEYIPGGWPEDASSFYSTTCVLAPSSGTASSNATLPSDIGEQSTTNADPNQGDPASDEQDVAHTHAQTEEAVEPAITHVRLLVSSTILATASPVFKTMLHGRFAEALLSFSRANPPTIYLGDDDPSAMMEFCRVMHHAPGIYKEMTCKTMEGLAVLCDKYMCAHALRGWFRGHAYEFLSGNRLTHLDDTDFSSAKLLRVGYLINDRDLFSSASNTFIENVCPADTRATLEGVFGEYLPERLVGMIECFQHEHIRKLAAIGPALLEDMRSLPFQAGYYPRRTLASIPLNNSMNRAQGTYNDPRLSSFQRSGRNPPRVVVQSGDFADPDDFNLCHGQAKRMGVLSAALTSMSLWPSQDPAVNSLRTPYTMIDAYKRIAGVYFQDEKLLCNKRDCQCHMAVNVNDEINRRIAEVEDDTLCGICLVCLKDSTIDFTSYAYGYPICNNHLDYHHGAV